MMFKVQKQFAKSTGNLSKKQSIVSYGFEKFPNLWLYYLLKEVKLPSLTELSPLHSSFTS